MKKANVETVKNLKVRIEKIVANEELSKSKKMIELFELGLEVKEIASIMEVRYNFVYNVVSNYSTVNTIATETNKKENKKDKIIELYLQKKSNKEISIELKTNYNYVFNTLKEYKLKNGANETEGENETEAM